MYCNSQDNLINQSDFECVGQVARHCDLPKLCISINEARNFDISNLFCGFWQGILTIWRELDQYDEEYAQYLIEFAECESDPECTVPPLPPIEPDDLELKRSLICGGQFLGCKGKATEHLGVRKIWVYYAYSRYILINGFNDTPGGQVSKTNDFSIPKTVKELETFANKYRDMGLDSFKKTLNFLCLNRDAFPDFDACECKGCGCGDEKCGGTRATGYGIRGGNIYKRI